MNSHIIVEVTIASLSFLSALYAAISLYKSKKIPVILYYTLSIMLFSGLELIGFIYKFNWKKAPIELCYFQALALEFTAFSIGACIFIFTIQTYRLLVLRVRNELTGSRWKKFYAMFLIMYPTVGTILVSIAAIKRRAVRITEFSCIVLDPLWVRLLGYNGPNTVLAIFSIYFACHATLVVIRHLYKFNPQPFPIHQEADEKNAEVETEADSSETQSSGKAIVSDSNESKDHTSCDSSKSRLSRTVSSTPALKTRNNRYKVTRAVIIRMTIFISTYVLVNINASIGVILTIIKREPVETGDLYVCGTVGILMCLVFGTTDKVIDRLGLKWVPDIQLCSRVKVFKKKNEQNI